MLRNGVEGLKVTIRACMPSNCHDPSNSTNISPVRLRASDCLQSSDPDQHNFATKGFNRDKKLKF